MLLPQLFHFKVEWSSGLEWIRPGSPLRGGTRGSSTDGVHENTAECHDCQEDDRDVLAQVVTSSTDDDTRALASAVA